MSCAKMAEPIEMPFGLWTQMRPRKHVLHGGAHWRHLANTTELSMCSCDAAFCQITLTTFFCYSCTVQTISYTMSKKGICVYDPCR